MSPRSSLSRFAPAVLIFLFSILNLLPVAPPLQPVPLRDSGVFLYAGWRILEGEIPYLHFWDHKPPLIFYIDALGLGVSGGSLWGVWIIELISLTASLVIAYHTLRRAFGRSAAGIAVYLAGLGFVLTLNGGNLTEEYALPLQLAIAALFAGKARLGAPRPQQVHVVSSVTGLLTGLLFLLRPNLVGAGVAVAIWIVITRVQSRKLGEMFSIGLAMALGAAVPIAICFGGFAAAGALDELLSAVFGFSTAYSRATLIERVGAAYTGFRTLASAGIGSIAIVGWLIGAVQLARRAESIGSLVALALIWLPVEVIFSSISGERFPHYYTAWLPPAAILTAYTVHVLLGYLRAKNGFPPKRRLALAGSALLIIFSLVPALRYGASIRNAIPYLEHGAEADPGYAFLKTEFANERFFIWGAETRYYFVLRRAAPSRFNYIYPLAYPDYATPEMIRQFMEELETSRPTAIIDTSAADFRTPPLDLERLGRWEQMHSRVTSAELLAAIRQIHTNYAFAGIDETTGWGVYTLKSR